MARASILAGFLDKIRAPQEAHPDCWSVIKVEKLLADVGAKGYEVLNEQKVVRMNSRSELMQILIHLVPSEVSSDYNLVLSKLEDEVRVEIGCWQFETRA